MLKDIGINLLSDLIFVIFAIVLAWLYYLLTKRKQLLKFFGINKSRRIFIYLSKIDVLLGGSKGIDSRPRSFQGEAITNQESKAANQLQSLFNYFLPSWGEKPGILNKLLIADIDVQTLISPATTHEVEQTNSFIAFGSSAYNAASEYMDARQDALGKFGLIPYNEDILPNVHNENHLPLISSPTEFIISKSIYHGGTAEFTDMPTKSQSESNKQEGSRPSGTPVDIPYLEPGMPQPAIIIKGEPPIFNQNVGYLERICDHEKQRSLFCTAGFSELGTIGAAYYLKTKWQELYKKYGADKSFLILFKFDSVDYRQSVIIHEINNKVR